MILPAALLLAWVPSTEDPPETIRLELDANAPRITTERLEQVPKENRPRGTAVEFEVEESGLYRIVLYSWDFDAYLVVEDPDGALVGEDDDDWLSPHAALFQVPLEAGVSYRATCASWDGRPGQAQLLVTVDEDPDVEAARAEELALLEAELASLEPRLTGDALAFARTRLAERLLRIESPERAREEFERALDWFLGSVGPDHGDTLFVSTQLGFALRDLGEEDLAAAHFRDVLVRYVDQLPILVACAAQEGLAEWHIDRGEFVEGMALLQETASIRFQVDPLAAGTRAVLRRCADLESERGFTATAVTYLEPLCAIYREIAVSSVPSVETHTELARLLHPLGRIDEARDILETTLEILEEAEADLDVRAAILEELATVELSGGGALARGVEHARSALALREEYGCDAAQLALSRAHLARMLGAAGRVEESEQEFARALGALDEGELSHVGPRLNLLLLRFIWRREAGELELAYTDLDRIGAILEEHDLFGTAYAHDYYLQSAFRASADDRYEDAEALLRSALEVSPGPSAGSARLRGLIGDLLLARERYYEAHEELEVALELQLRAHGALSRSMLPVLADAALAAKETGRFADAMQLYAWQFEILDLYPDALEVADAVLVERKAAKVLLSLGQMGSARLLFERAIERLERGAPEELGLRALLLQELGLSLYEAGILDEAVAHLEEALEIFEAEYGTDSLEYAGALMDHMVARANAGDTEGMAEVFAHTRTLMAEVFPPDHEFFALICHNEASVAWLEGRGEEALERIREARDIYARRYGPSHPEAAEEAGPIATVLLDLGRPEEALAELEPAYAILREALGPHHPSTLSLQAKRAVASFAAGDAETAWTLALDTLSGAREELESALSTWTEGEQFRLVESRRWLLDVLISLGAQQEHAGAAAEAHEVVLAWKGQASRLQSGDRRRLQEDPEAAEGLARLRDVQAELSRLLYQTDASDSEERAAQLEALREERRELELYLQLEVGERESALAADAAALRSALPEGSCALDFLVASPYDAQQIASGDVASQRSERIDHLICWIVPSGGGDVVQIDLGPVAPIQAAVEEHALALERSRGYGTEEDTPNDELLRLLWTPLEPHLQEHELLVIAADGFLGRLPFETIERADGTFLIEHYRCAYLPDLSLLPALLERDVARGSGLLAVGGVEYGFQIPGLSDDPLRSYTSGFTQWDPLPYTSREAAAVRAMHERAFEDPATERRVLLDDEPTEETLKELLPRYDVVHLATHGFFRPEGLRSMKDRVEVEGSAPLFEMRREESSLVGFHPGLLSGIVLAGANDPDPESDDEGLLTAEEVGWLDLSEVDLVVLSACESGLGRPESGEGLLGLRRAFHMAGARTVVSSLYEVRDRETSQLVSLFYRGLWFEGKSALDALRDAQLELLNDARAERGQGDPGAWGAFVLSGDWR